MSSATIIAKRYAKALFFVAQERKEVEQVEQQLRAIVSHLQQHPAVSQFIEHPNIPAEAKLNLISDILGQDFGETLRNTVGLLLERGRERILSELLVPYAKFADEAAGRATAIVQSARPLSDDEKKGIEASFSKLTGKKIQIENETDSGLLGGIRVRIGDRLYDGSLSSKLRQMEKTLAQS